MKISRQHLKDLCTLLGAPKDGKEMQLLLSDLLSPKELAVLSERWQLVQMLSRGLPQRMIAKKLRISISKVTRGSHALQRSKGGFKRFLNGKKRLRK